MGSNQSLRAGAYYALRLLGELKIRRTPDRKRRTTSAASHLVSTASLNAGPCRRVAVQPATLAGEGRTLRAAREGGYSYERCVAMLHSQERMRYAPCPGGPACKPCGAFLLTRRAANYPGQDRPGSGTEVTLEVTSARNLVSTTVSGYLKFGS